MLTNTNIRSHEANELPMRAPTTTAGTSTDFL